MPPITYDDLARVHNEQQVHVHQNLFEYLGWLNLLRELEPEHYVELGTYRLGSAQLVLECVPTVRRLVTVDRSALADDPALAGKLSSCTATGRLKFVQGRTHDPQTIRSVWESLPQFADALFIDADHRLTPVMRDYVFYSQMVRAGGLIGFHDVRMEGLTDGPCRMHQGTLSFWNALQRNYPRQCQLIDAEPGPWGNYGIGVYRVLADGNND